MQYIKVFNAVKGQSAFKLTEGSKLTRNQIVKFLHGTAYMWDASTFKRNLEKSSFKKRFNTTELLTELFDDIDHPIILYNMTCVLESPAVLKDLFKLNDVFSTIAGETVYGNVLVVDIMQLPEAMVNEIQPDEHDYSRYKI